MLDHQGRISIPATVARESVFVSTVISNSLAHDIAYVMDYANLATALSAQMQASIELIGIIRELSVEPIVFAK